MVPLSFLEARDSARVSGSTLVRGVQVVSVCSGIVYHQGNSTFSESEVGEMSAIVSRGILLEEVRIGIRREFTPVDGTMLCLQSDSSCPTVLFS